MNTQAGPAKEKVNILLVDDRPDKLIAIESVLAELDENVLVANSGADALRLLLRHDVAVMLLDVNMPGMDGFETAALIRQRKNFEHTPIIFITGINVNENHVSQGYSLGAVDYILSPVVPEILKTKVAVFIELYRNREQVRRQGELLLAAAEKRAAGLESRLENLLNGLNLGVFSCSADRRIIDANPAFLNILCISDVKQTPTIIIERLFALSARRPGSDESRNSGGEDIEIRLADGSVRWYSLSTTVRNAGKATILEGLLEDITARKSAEEGLRESDRRKDRFLAILSHELRNPLAALQSAIQLSDRLGAADGEQWTREIVSRQVKHLGRLTDDLLDIARINNDKLDLKMTEMDLSASIQRAIDVVRPSIETQQHCFTAAIEQGLYVQGDTTRIEQSIANLLQNASKYTPEGGTISLTACRDGADVKISVADTGVGIPGDMLPRIFDPFMQSDNSLDRSQGGLGIGLTLVRRLVEMHKGRVSASSDGEGKGSEFTVWLPEFERQAVDPCAVAHPPPHQGAGKILVVDDNMDSVMLLAALLRLSGYSVETAHDGYSALEMAERVQPAVVLLDIGLPGIDGYEVARRMRQTPSLRDVFLVAISGYGQKNDIAQAYAAGFQHHLVKPVDFEVLTKILETKKSAAQTSEPDSPEVSPPAYT